MVEITDSQGTEVRPPGTLRRKLKLFSVSTLVALLCMEVTVRFTHGAPLAERLPLMRIQANPTRGWEMVPSEDHYTYLEKVEVNSLGLRGPEVPPKPSGVRRILMLGDSLIYGQGVGETGTVPYFLQEQLDAASKSGEQWDVVNGGYRAYDTRQELALLEELGPDIAPDIVILSWYWNDLIENDIQTTYEQLAETGTLTFDTGGRMEGATKRKWQVRQLLRKSALFMVAHDVVHRDDVQAKLPDPIDGSLEAVGTLLDRFVELSEELDFEALVAIMPDPLAIDHQDHFSTELGERVADLARERGLGVLTPLQQLEAARPDLDRLPTLPHDGHYDATGNEIIGRGIANELLQPPRAGG